MSDLSNKPVGAFFSPECGTCRGITLREHFAGLAMMGILSGLPEDVDYNQWLTAKNAVNFADELIAELERAK